MKSVLQKKVFQSKQSFFGVCVWRRSGFFCVIFHLLLGRAAPMSIILLLLLLLLLLVLLPSLLLLLLLQCHLQQRCRSGQQRQQHQDPPRWQPAPHHVSWGDPEREREREPNQQRTLTKLFP